MLRSTPPPSLGRQQTKRGDAREGVDAHIRCVEEPVIVAKVLSGLARVLLLLLVVSSVAWGHAGSKSNLTLRVEEDAVRGQLVASLVDVAIALRLDSGQAREQVRQQVAAREPELRAYVTKGLVALLDGRPARLEFGRISDAELGGEPALLFEFGAVSPERIRALDILYTLFFEDDLIHEGLARIEWGEGRATNVVFRVNEPLVHVESNVSGAREFWQFLKTGALHVLTGYDHVLFLIALLLPSVLLGTAGSWVPAPQLSKALLRAAAVVTAFTLAHSLVLGLAAVWHVDLPTRLVEPAIAASVFIAAACNLIPGATALGGGWMAFVFGLVHGTAFAQILEELITDRGNVLRPLLAFNLGVELGQLAVVAIFFPLAWTLRKSHFYRRVVVGGGSIALCACATVWFFARVW